MWNAPMNKWYLIRKSKTKQRRKKTILPDHSIMFGVSKTPNKRPLKGAESQVKFLSQQNISVASQQNSNAAFSWTTEVDGGLF